MANMNILMVGGRRSGKTSALATIFRTMQGIQLTNYFNIVDTTTYEAKNQGGINEVQDNVKSKSMEMTRFAEKAKLETPILVDAAPTLFDWQYKLNFAVPGHPQNNLCMTFTDVPGEWCRTTDNHYNIFLRYAREADVFVITIDTPYLMGPTDELTRQLCGAQESELATLAGCMSDLRQTFNEIQDENNKLVLFVPIKCEKWYNSGCINAVNNQIRNAFGVLLADITQRPYFTVGILPILTIGTMEFLEFHDPKYLNSVEKDNRCCKIDDTSARMADGSVKPLRDNDKFIDDPNWAFPAPNNAFLRPVAWYICKRNEYAPVNSEQLALHILRFMIYNTENLQKKTLKSGDSLLQKLRALIDLIRAKFGSMGEDALKNILDKMKKDGLFRDEEDGITYLKNPLNIQ